MRDLKNKLTSSKNTKNIQSKKGKSFGYQVLGFGSGGDADAFIAATGGTITTVDTNFKVHTFNGPGTFAVSAGAGALAVADYLVIAGGGGGGAYGGGGAGAGGYRESHVDATSGPYTASPLASSTSIEIAPGSYPIVIGAGGTGHPNSYSNGGVSSGLGIESAGGGFGGTDDGNQGQNGGSAGGGGRRTNGGTGNTPPVSPAQGTNGGNGVPDFSRTRSRWWWRWSK